MHLGTLIRKVRTARRVTLLELAKRTRIDPATLSRIETGKMTGTIGSHRALARALGLRLSELYAGLDGDAREVVSVQAEDDAPPPVTTYTPGRASAQVLTTQVLEKKMLPALITLDPRGRTPREKFPIGTERFLYILDGALTVAVRDQRHALTARQTIYFDAHLPHQLSNPTSRPTHCLSVLTPPVV